MSTLDATALGTVKRIEPRLAWQHEALDFTPWLEQHADELSARLGLDIEITGREEGVGPFAADLFGTDLGTGGGLIIENQLAPTDHSHLGQIVTYAAGLDAKVMVWVATEIRDEHRQAINWLNEATREEYSFFAVRVELLEINGQVAPDFVVVASPNAFQKRLRDHAARPSKRGEKYRAIWTTFLTRLKAADPTLTRASAAQAANWMSFSGGYGLAFSNEGPRVELYLDEPTVSNPKAAFDALHGRAAEIERDVGAQLSWERLDGKRASRIGLYTTGTWEAEGPELDGIISFLVDGFRTFKRVFPKYLPDAMLEAATVASEAADEVSVDYEATELS